MRNLGNGLRAESDALLNECGDMSFVSSQTGVVSKLTGGRSGSGVLTLIG